MKKTWTTLISLALIACFVSAEAEDRRNRDYRNHDRYRDNRSGGREYYRYDRGRDRQDYRERRDYRDYRGDNRFHPDRGVWREIRECEEKICRLEHKIREYQRKTYYSGRYHRHQDKIDRLSREIMRLEMKIRRLKRQHHY